jgi:glycosyltransferase involved in cell wall biosynthesis
VAKPTARRKRVLFVTSPYGWGGSEKHTEDVIKRAHPEHIEAAILAVVPSLYSEALAKMGRGDVVVRQESVSTFRGYRRIFADCRPDAIVFVNGALGLFPWWVYAAARMSGARVIGLEHLQALPAPPHPRGGLFGPLRRMVGWRARHMLKYKATAYLSHMTVCVSDAVRRTVVEYGYPEARTITVYNGIDLQYYRRRETSRTATRPALGLAQNDQVLVYVARLGRLKRIDILLQAVVLLSGRRPALKCVIVGGGPQESELNALVQSLGLQGVAFLAGHHEDVRPYLEATDVYVSSSEREGFGLALVEAMAYELPCVATRIGGHDEVLAVPGTGVLVAPGSAEDLAGAIEHLLDHPEEARAMGIAARSMVEERFDIERMVRELLSIFLGRT